MGIILYHMSYVTPKGTINKLDNEFFQCLGGGGGLDLHHYFAL